MAFFSIVALSLATVVACVASGCGGAHGGTGAGDSEKIDLFPQGIQVLNLAELQKAHSRAVLTPQPWAGYWWPYVGGGIGSSWRDAAGLSPADKYDQAYKNFLRSKGKDIGKYEPMADWERGRHGPGLASVASWWGHCNGWAAAALMIAEPTVPKTIDGVTFEVRDQKALLAESWMEFSGDFLGHRVEDEHDFSSGAFWDVVPAQFHLLLTNVMGKENRGIIIDRYTGVEIWNQPLVAYAIDPIRKEDDLGEHPDFPGVYRVNVTARIWWANDNVRPDDVTPVFDFDRLQNEFADAYFPGRVLHYELWLDGPLEFDASGALTRSGDILVTHEGERYVGGVWKNGTNPAALIHSHPDYMWVPFGIQKSSGYKNPRIDDAWVREHIGGPNGDDS